MSILTARGVVKRFGGVVALNGVEISLSAGRVGGLLGANGAGKSVLSAILAGEITPDEGEMSFDGRPISHPSPRAARDHGIVIAHRTPASCRTCRSGKICFSERNGAAGSASLTGRVPHRSGGNLGAALPGLRYRSPCRRAFERGAATGRDRACLAAKAACSHPRRTDRQPRACRSGPPVSGNPETSRQGGGNGIHLTPSARGAGDLRRRGGAPQRADRRQLVDRRQARSRPAAVADDG